MKFAIFDHLDRNDEPLGKFYDERLALVQRADAAGLTGYHIAEHHWNPVGMAPRPGVFIGAAAKLTKRIRLGPLAYALSFHNPMIIAEEICMLDHLTGGRFDLGVGRGISPWELALFGIPLPETRDLFRESMEVLLQYFTSDVVNHRGKRWQFYDVPVEIKPLQKPFPPLWYGSTSGVTRDLLASLGASVVGGWAPSARIRQQVDAYREAWDKNKAAPHRAGAPAEPTVGSVRMVVIADSDAEAEAAARPAHDRWYKSLEKLGNSFGFRALFLAPDYDLAKRAGYVIAGTPDTVKAALTRHIEEAGINYLCLQLAFGVLSHAQAVRTVDAFAKEVMPALAKVVPGAAKVAAPAGAGH